jgi:hypothetical protein
MLSDLILVSTSNAEDTAHVIFHHLAGLSRQHIKLMLKECPVRLLSKQPLSVLKPIAADLEAVGGKVKILPCR